MTKADQPLGDSEYERAFRVWQDRRIEELSRDPVFRAEVEESARREAEGLPPEGRLMTFDELRRRAQGESE